MGIHVNTNVSSQLVQGSLLKANKELEASIAKLSTGKKLTAMEDAANLILSETLEAKARGNQVAAENSQTGINALQTADAGLESVNENLQRIRELSVQAANGTYGDEERKSIQSEISSLTDEINRVAKTTTFNKEHLLDGTNSELAIQAGGSNGDTIKVGDALNSVKTDDLGLINSQNIETSLSSSADFAQYVDSIDTALKNVTSQRANIGAYQNRLESNVNSLNISTENTVASQSRIRDTDVAAEMAKYTQNQILSNASTSLLAQANQTPAIAMSLL